jgi:acyl carrier protein
MQDEADRLLVEVLEHSGEPIWSDQTDIADLPAIDSLKHMALVLAVETRLGRKLDIEQLVGLETVGDLRRLLAPVGA